jgi:hypothetical protein
VWGEGLGNCSLRISQSRVLIFNQLRLGYYAKLSIDITNRHLIHGITLAFRDCDYIANSKTEYLRGRHGPPLDRPQNGFPRRRQLQLG